MASTPRQPEKVFLLIWFDPEAENHVVESIDVYATREAAEAARGMPAPWVRIEEHKVEGRR